MKKARDSFYVALRDRLQVLNPSRQVLIRGVWRPGVLVEENESFAAIVPDNVFVLRWTKTRGRCPARTRTHTTDLRDPVPDGRNSFCGRIGSWHLADCNGRRATVDFGTAADTED